MEDSPLFLAHQNDRKAETHIRYKRFDEAAVCHQKASGFLLQAMQLTSVSRALESLQLQHDYHLRQKDIIRIKKVQFELKKKYLDYKNRRMTTHKKEKKSQSDDLQSHIFRIMDETDSLLSFLQIKIEENNVDVKPSTSEKPPASGQRKLKSEQAIMEELNSLNTELRNLIKQLFAELQSSERQVEALRIRLKAYEEDFPALPDLTPLEIPQYEYTSATTEDIFPELV
uniref:Nuclear receptor-binding factor 2 MIT domain-containing protein n=1 Tax=Clastoptera arizonana TaxID=38151 RepID=A0A1B6CK25_9HEMI